MLQNCYTSKIINPCSLAQAWTAEDLPLCNIKLIFSYQLEQEVFMQEMSLVLDKVIMIMHCN